MDAPCIISYDSWTRNLTLAVHEFFHTLSLGDKEKAEFKGNLMYHLEANGKTLNVQQKTDLIHYIILEVNKLTSSTYQNAGMNTLVKLRTQLNDPANAVRYNRDRFR